MHTGEVQTVIPEPGWQDVQGDAWRGAAIAAAGSGAGSHVVVGLVGQERPGATP